MDDRRAMLVHFLAAVAYRAQKALRGCPDEFGSFSVGHDVRTPSQLVQHITSVLGYARTFFVGGSYWPEPLPTLSDEVDRMHQMIKDLAGNIESGAPFLNELTEQRLLQGPLADAMTHVGQLAMLRRIAGEPVPPENFIVADIDAKRLGVDQPDPVSPDEVWPEAPKR